MLEDIFGERDAIADSDQGKSFRTFWDFLMSPARQEELSELIACVFELAPVKDLAPDPRLLRVHYDWLEAGEHTQRTVARLSEQLRHYLDEQAWLENRRIMQLLREIESGALALRESPPAGTFMQVDEPAAGIEIAMERPLFSPPIKPVITQQALQAGESDLVTDALYDQVYVDKIRLAGQVRRALQARAQIGLADLVAQYPLQQGLAELVAYLSLASEDRAALIDDSASQTIIWQDADQQYRQATLPQVIFSR